MPECHLHLLDDSAGQAIFESEGRWFRVAFDTECVPHELPDKLAVLRSTLSNLYEATDRTFPDQQTLVSRLWTRWQGLLDVDDTPLDAVIQLFPESLRRAWETSKSIEHERASWKERWGRFLRRRATREPRNRPSPRYPAPYPFLMPSFEPPLGDEFWHWAWLTARSFFEHRYPALDAEDLASNVVTKLYPRREELKSTPAFPAFLLRVCHNTASDYFRAAKARSRQPEPPQALESLTSLEPQPAEVASSHEEAILLRDAIMQLPEQSQEMLLMRYFGEMTSKEIAQQFGVSQAKVDRRIRNAIISLRQMLAD